MNESEKEVCGADLVHLDLNPRRSQLLKHCLWKVLVGRLQAACLAGQVAHSLHDLFDMANMQALSEPGLGMRDRVLCRATGREGARWEGGFCKPGSATI